MACKEKLLIHGNIFIEKDKQLCKKFSLTIQYLDVLHYAQTFDKLKE